MLIFLLIPVIAIIGWYLGSQYKHKSSKANTLPRDYFVGLQYLIDEQPDKAVDIFVKMLEVNAETVETHLALGGLFRRRGEVNRAIRVHQNLIARPQLSKNQRLNALHELAKDYKRAGVLDRAEKLFLELIKTAKDTLASFKHLIDIYEQQKDWQQAINVAKKLQVSYSADMKTPIAHYYCELNNAKMALLVDKNCVRASLLQGESYLKQGDFKAAIKAYKKVKDQDSDYISEIISPLAKCYESLEKEQDFINYLQLCLKEQPRISIILALAGFLKKYQNDFAAIEFIVKQIDNYPSLRGLNCLTQLYLDNSDNNTKRKFLLLREIMNKLLSNKPVYRCIHCGFSSKSLYWHCPACKRWSSIKPIHGIEGD